MDVPAGVGTDQQVAALVEQAKKVHAIVQRTGRQYQEDAARLLVMAAQMDEPTLTLLIETAETLEEQRRHDHQKLLADCKKVLRRLPRLRPEFRAVYPPAIREASGLQAEILTSMRDTRWALMAIRAERFPSKPSGPVRGIASPAA